MASKAQALRMMEKLGVPFDDEDILGSTHRGLSITIQAPEGHYFAATGYHSCSSGGWMMKDFWDNLVDDLQYGVKPCDENCDSCTNP